MKNIIHPIKLQDTDDSNQWLAVKMGANMDDMGINMDDGDELFHDVGDLTWGNAERACWVGVYHALELAH